MPAGCGTRCNAAPAYASGWSSRHRRPTVAGGADRPGDRGGGSSVRGGVRGDLRQPAGGDRHGAVDELRRPPTWPRASWRGGRWRWSAALDIWSRTPQSGPGPWSDPAPGTCSTRDRCWRRRSPPPGGWTRTSVSPSDGPDRVREVLAVGAEAVATLLRAMLEADLSASASSVSRDRLGAAVRPTLEQSPSGGCQDHRQQPPERLASFEAARKKNNNRTIGYWSSAWCSRWLCSPTRSTCSWTTWALRRPGDDRRDLTAAGCDAPTGTRPRATRTVADGTKVTYTEFPPASGSTTRRRRRSPSTSTRWPTGRRSRRWC